MALLYWALPSKGIEDLMTNPCTGKELSLSPALLSFEQQLLSLYLGGNPTINHILPTLYGTKKEDFWQKCCKCLFELALSVIFIGYWLFFYWVSGSYSVRSWISSLYLLLFREEYDFSCFLRIPTFHFAKFDLFTGAISANHKHSSPWIQVRQFVLAIRGKSFLHSRIRYYANSDSCFQQTRLLVSGDVPFNPGPVTNASKCSVCSKTVVRNHRAVNCDQCHKWCHIKCGQVKPRDYKVFQNMASFDWVCPPCLKIGLTLNDSRLHVPATNESASVNIQESVDPLRSLWQLVGDKNIQIDHSNINGLVNKLPEVQLLLEVANFAILGITETHPPNTDFEHAPWHLVSLFDDIDDCHFIWNSLYNDIIDHHLPSRKAKIRSKSLSWTDSSIRKGMNKRFKLLNEAKASGDPVKWSQYRKKKRNEVKKSVKEGRSGLLEWSI